ncbi:MAG: hypothetical protein ACRC3B_22630, partial [Bacteroidia bacterium]
MRIFIADVLVALTARFLEAFPRKKLCVLASLRELLFHAKTRDAKPGIIDISAKTITEYYSAANDVLCMTVVT